MKRFIKISVAIWIVLTMFTSCRAISRLLHGDEVVAQVYDATLFRSDLDKVIPAGLPEEDSVRLANQYINSWALEHVFIGVAEEQLSKAEKDVMQELEAYRRSLLKYRYEQLYVNERLDTAVSENMVQKYYEDNSEMFVLKRPVVKARFLSISSQSPMLEQIRKKMSSSELADMVEVDSLAYSSALKYMTWEGKWIDINNLSLEFGLDNATLLSKKKGNWIEVSDSVGLTNLAYISAFKDKGEMAPLEYSTPSIKDKIVSVRKQELVNSLEQNLLEDARENGKFKTY
ncbi:MAG: hypothetical protein IKW11_00525 [Bacteroidales bacterium]|nr:hypothetical protein [Bacteroidales bacterium]